MNDKAKIWFFTDFHGSNSCFRKFLNLVNHESKPNVLIIGADVTGKQIVPLIESTNNTFIIPINGKEIKKKNSEKSITIKQLSDIGYYPWECTLDEFKKFDFNDEYKDKIFEKLAKERLEEWIVLADSKLENVEDCQVIINSGNDDPFFVDEILKKSKKIIYSEGKIINLPANLKLLSTGYTTKTPWPCPRDVSEDELKKIITKMTDKIDDSNNLIFNFHCPPKNTSLDLANNLDKKTLKRKYGTKHVGSSAIREAIEFWKPIVSLHGHIHEVSAKEKIGDTMCYNPGSDYFNGKLQGVFLIINLKGEIEFEMITSEKISVISEKEGENLIKTIFKNIPFIGSLYKDHSSSKKQDEIKSILNELKKDVEEIKNKHLS